MAEITSLDELTETPHERVFAEPRPKTVRLELAAGEQVPEHTHPGRDVLLYVVSGRLYLSLDGETHRLDPGDTVRFSGDRDVSPTAIDDTTALVVLAPRP